MTLDDLEILFRNKIANGFEIRDGVTAVVRALRDEFGYLMYSTDDWNRIGIQEVFNEILGDAGEKVVGGGGENPHVSGSDLMQTPATDAAPAVVRCAATAVCVWTPYFDEDLGTNWWRSCRGVRHRYPFDGHHPCSNCGKPIKFTEAK